jgi:hypothetical protein
LRLDGACEGQQGGQARDDGVFDHGFSLKNKNLLTAAGSLPVRR